MRATVYKYNNYFNRIIKKSNNIGDYAEYACYTQPGINFRPNNKIDTTIIMNYTSDFNDDPDYLIVTDDEDEIVSRWWIISSTRLREGQYSLSIKRDLIADYYDEVINAPCFIQRAMLQAGDPAIFNNEGMTYNQIKKGEELLKDSSGCAWLVGYVARNDNNGNKISYSVTTQATSDPDIIGTVNGINNWDYYQYIDNDFIPYDPSNDILDYRFFIEQPLTYGQYGSMQHEHRYTVSRTNVVDKDNGFGNSDDRNYRILQSGSFPSKTPIKNILSSDDWDLLETQVSQLYQSYNSLSNLLRLDNKYILDNLSNVYYKISVKPNGQNTDRRELDSGSEAYRLINNKILTLPGVSKGKGTSYISVSVNSTKYRISLSKVTKASVTLDITTARRELVDAPYDMIAIPYIDYDNGDLSISKDISMRIMSNLTTNFYESGRVYDAQLLPFCPCMEYINGGIGNYHSLEEHVDFEFIYEKTEGSVGDILGIVYYPKYSTFTVDIPFNIPMEFNNIEAKIKSETEFYRLCSPNYASIFEFNSQMNGGVTYFNVDCTYKPYSPYIHINPDFNDLYGADRDEPRGLICGGDFSLPIVSNEWSAYELNNKNYQLIFNRQIEDMRINRNIDRTGDIVSAIAGSVTGGIMGGIAGGAGPTAIAGAAIGAGLSLAGGITDVALNEKRYNEAVSYAKDNFNYAMGNIKARGETLTRVSAFNANNKIFPVLEFYSCTDEEIEALRKKIEYNSMSVGRIGTIRDYIQEDISFIKGDIIRLDEIKSDARIAAEINNEIRTGVYI